MDSSVSPAVQVALPSWHQATGTTHAASPTQAAPFGKLLVMVFIGQALAALILFRSLLDAWRGFSDPHLRTLLTSPDSAHYHPLWSTLIFYDLVGKAALLTFGGVLLWLFSERKAWLRPLMIVYLLGMVLYLAGGHLIGAQIPEVRATDAHHNHTAILHSILSAAIWVPYFAFSKRAKRVFVH